MTWIVHVGGLVRTGSGAVKDALLDTGDFLTLKGKSFAMSESRLFVGRPPIPSFVARAGTLTALDILALWTAGTRLPEGAVISPWTRRFISSTVRSHGVNRKFLLKVGDAELRVAAEETAADVAKARSRTGRAEAYIIGTRRAIRRLLPLDGRMVLIDNDPAVSTQVTKHLRLDPHCIFIGVIRDLSDQFTDRRTGINTDHSRPFNLAYMTTSALLRRRYFDELADAVDAFPDRCLIVEFERFVTDATYRHQFLDAVAPAGESREREGPVRFEAATSARNVRLKVPRRDRLQHAVYTRLLAGPYQRAKERSGPDVWPVVATTPGSR